MKAFDITRLLEERHRDDVFVSQCKDGASYGAGLLILDGWAMKKSWANPCVTGYEIKVSRSDFLRDDKWRGYLAYCNEFYFVCPAGLLKPEEIPEPAGLLCASKTGGVLFRKKRAVWRDVQIPLSIYQYILMSRVKVTRETTARSKRDFWEKWLKTETIDKSFGWNVGKRLHKVIEKRITDVDYENERLRNRQAEYDDIRLLLKSMNIDPDQGWLSTHHVRERAEKLRAAVPPELKTALHSASTALDRFMAELAKIDCRHQEANSAPSINDGGAA